MCQLKESKIIVEGAFARVLELMWPSSLNLFTCLAISHVESGAGVQFTILHILQLSVPCQICVKTKCPSLKMHICHPRPAPHSNFVANAVEFLRKKWAADFLPPQTAADIRHSSNGLLYVAANQGFISPGYIQARARGTQCEECQIFGTEVWDSHLIVNLSLQTFSKRVWGPKMAQKIGRGEFFGFQAKTLFPE